MFNKYFNKKLGTLGECWAIESEYELSDKTEALYKYGKLWQNKLYMPIECEKMQKLWNNFKIKPKNYIVNKAYNLVSSNRLDDSLFILNTYLNQNTYHLNYINALKTVTKDLSMLDVFISKYYNYKYFSEIFIQISKNAIKKDSNTYIKIWNNLENKSYLSEKQKMNVYQ